MNELRNGWIYFNNRGIIKNVKLPEYGKVTLTVVDGVITYMTTETQIKL